MPCLVNGYLNYKGNRTSIVWIELTWGYRQYVPLKHWYRHTRWHGVVIQRITILTSAAMKTPSSPMYYTLHKWVPHLLRAGFLKAFGLVYHQTKFKNFNVLHFFLVQIHWGLSEQSDIETCDRQVPNCELISLAIKNLKYENWNVFTLEVTHPHCAQINRYI